MKKLILISACLMLISNSSSAENLGSKEVLLDNPTVEVVRLTYPAGTESGMHTHAHPNRVVYFVKGGHLELIPDDNQETTQRILTQDGQTLYLPATTHNVRNIGDTEVIIVETEIKQ